jgi:hypothetical protein
MPSKQRVAGSNPAGRADQPKHVIWEITKFSGAVSRERKAQLIENAEALLAGLRQARERANHEGAPPVSIGSPAWTFLLG